MLDKKQTDKFVEMYMDRYAIEWETTQECSQRVIHEWIEWYDISKEMEFFYKDIPYAILWEKQAKSIYKKRMTHNQTRADKVWWELWLWYWPKFIWEDIKIVSTLSE